MAQSSCLLALGMTLPLSQSCASQMWSQGPICLEIVLVSPAWKLAERCLIQEVFDHRELEVLEPCTWEEAAEARDHAFLGE